MSPAPARRAEVVLALPFGHGEAAALEPSAPVLRALARADGVPAPDTLAAFLFSEFGVAAAQPGIGALTALADGVDTQGRAVLRLDPVHLRPDRGRLYLLDAGRFPLADDEADAMIAALNEACLPAGTQLLRGRSAQRWYLLGGDAAAASDCDPRAASGASVDDLEAGGAARLAWHRVLNEIQMCLHELELNAAREAAGHPPVNSVWLWGAGPAPSGLAARFRSIVADEPVAAGLAVAAGAALQRTVTPAALLDAAQGGSALAVATAAQAAAMLEAAVSLARRSRVSLWLPGGRRDLHRWTGLRVWRQPRPLSDYLPGEGP